MSSEQNEIDTDGDGPRTRYFVVLPRQPVRQENANDPPAEPARDLIPPAEGQAPTYFQPDITTDLRQPAIILSPPMVREPIADSYRPQYPEAEDAETVPEEPPKDVPYVPVDWSEGKPEAKPQERDSYLPTSGDSSETRDETPEKGVPVPDSYMPSQEDQKGSVEEVPPPVAVAEAKSGVPEQDSYLPTSGDKESVPEVPPVKAQSDSYMPTFQDEAEETVTEVAPAVPEATYAFPNFDKSTGTTEDSYRKAKAAEGEETVPESPPAEKKVEPEEFRLTDLIAFLSDSVRKGLEVIHAPAPEDAKTAPVDSTTQKDSYLPDAADTSDYKDDYAAFGVPPLKDAPVADHSHHHEHEHTHEEQADAETEKKTDDKEDDSKSDSTSGDRPKRHICKMCGGGYGGYGGHGGGFGGGFSLPSVSVQIVKPQPGKK